MYGVITTFVGFRYRGWRFINGSGAFFVTRRFLEEARRYTEFFLEDGAEDL